MTVETLKKQMDFIVEIDKVKNIFRQNYISDGSRRENDAEHSWHLAMMAFILVDHAPVEVDLLKVIKMVLIHDLVEIDAGDTFLYDTLAYQDKEAREEKAAKRLFSILPDDQNQTLLSLWYEFEHQESKEAQYAADLDGIHPIINNYLTKGAGWKKYKVTAENVLIRKAHIEKASPLLWEYTKSLILECKAKGYLL